MLAYLLWHRPRRQADAEAYESAAERFHRSLRHSPPAGFRHSTLTRIGGAPWLDGERWYEDWYLLDDFCALGVLNEAAVAAGHRSAHDRVAGLFEHGAGAVYKLIEGSCEQVARPALAVWVSRPAGAAPPALGEMLGDGADARSASLWRRALVLGPAPEHCLLADEQPRGTFKTRLPHGWQASILRAEVIFDGRAA